MSLPDVKFESIRQYDGSQQIGFEELCTQLASLEKYESGATFHRKGRGGDGGVECYLRSKYGNETAWQAKYIFEWSASLKRQLDDSLNTALKKHPDITEYIVCLPFDLPDSRPSNGESAAQKWHDWKTGYEKTAASMGRNLSITLWGKFQLHLRLTKDSPEYAGRLFYWFDTSHYGSDWFQKHFQAARVGLGSRYTPETNIELPIRQSFLAFARTPSLATDIVSWTTSLSQNAINATRATERASGEDSASTSILADLRAATMSIQNTFDSSRITPDKNYPLSDWSRVLEVAKDAANSALRLMYDLQKGKSSTEPRDKEYARHALYKYLDTIRSVSQELASDRWRVVNAKALLLSGQAGTGKSHLLADVVQHQLAFKYPAILILGSSMIEGEPWKQIISQLDLPSTLQVKFLLGGLDAAAQAAGVRALICIDGINERHGSRIWKERLATFLKIAEEFSHIGVVVSCRTTYVEYVVPQYVRDKQLETIVHPGFSEDGGNAANHYLEARGIIRPGAPNLAPEFHNPLFLKTCCDSLEKNGKNELPRGLQGVTSIFNFYHQAVIRAVTNRLELDPRLKQVSKAIDQFTDLLVDRAESHAPLDEVHALFENIFPSQGKLDTSLTTQLESEGILTIEPSTSIHGSPQELVRFTFERYSDHSIATSLLSKYLDKEDVHSAFMPEKPLGELIFGDKNYLYAGIIEAIAIQLPELTNIEIVELRKENDWTVEQAFLESFLLREQTRFTNRTLELARFFYHESEVLNLLIAVSTEPKNIFNAMHLHSRLSDLTMPERDARWSVNLNTRGESDDPFGILISWAIRNGMGNIEPARAKLAGIILTWFFTSSNRELRDKATKGLACILSTRLDLAVELLKLFRKIDDLYLQERLVASCYGAALQGKTTDGLSSLSQIIYELYFKERHPPCNELLRDYGRCLILYSEYRGNLHSTIDLQRISPPHNSNWPIEYVSDEQVSSYTQDYGGGHSTDQIVSSTVNDGDFARYIIDYHICDWAPVPIGSKRCPSSRELAENWIKSFNKNCTKNQAEYFSTILAAAKAAKESPHEYTPERKALKDAEAELQAELSEEAWEEYRANAQSFIAYLLFADDQRDFPPRLDGRWARRWICMRAHELGWTPERFAEIERGSSDRHEHRVERIGKKYQWLAFRELISRMADNLLYMGAGYGNDIQTFSISTNTGLRDIDPTLLTTETHYDAWKQFSSTWWLPVQPQLEALPPLERLAWLETSEDMINYENLIAVTDPKSSKQWFALNGFSIWQQQGVDDEHIGTQRETWHRIQCLVVRTADTDKAIKYLSDKNLIDPHALPDLYFEKSFSLGEYPWHPRFASIDDWIEPMYGDGIPVAVRPCTVEYLCERGNYDYSIDNSVSIKLPAPWLVNALELRMKDGRTPVFIDQNGTERFFDTSVKEPGHATALIDRESFTNMLDAEGLTPIWIITREKSVHGGNDGFGGRLAHTAIYTINEKNEFSCTLHSERLNTSPEQLERLLNEPPSSELIDRLC